MEIFVARQPILDAKKNTYAYELLFRDGVENSFPNIDGDTATFRLLSNTFFTMGVNDISGSKPVFINFPQDLVEKKVPLFFPKDKIVVEVLEDVKPSKDVVEALVAIKKKGFRIALDDFLYTPELMPLIKQAEVIKFDFRLSKMDEVRSMIATLNKIAKVRFLAEKIETHEEFEQALEMGCTLFQGYFFEKPQVLSNKTLGVNQTNLLRLVSQVSQADINFNKLAQMIRDDVTMSYKLLKYINSAFYKRSYPIDSIKDAISMLGEKDIRQFIMMIAATGLSEGKPEEMLKTSIITGYLLEKLATIIKIEFTPEELFTLGLFSNIEAMLEIPIEKIVSDLPFSKKIKDALSGKSQKFTFLKDLIQGFMKGKWEKTQRFCTNFNIDQQKLLDCYQGATIMADDFLSPAS